MNELNISNVLSINVEFTTADGIQITGLSNINESLSTHYIIYKIHNIENGKHYIGQHATDDPFDTYMGSGKLIQRSLDKRPISSFVKEILFDFDNFDEMNIKEQELVPLSSCYPNDPMSYNLREGGFNGKHTEESKIKNGLAVHNAWINKSEEDKELFRQKLQKAFLGENNPMFGKDWREGKTNEELQLHRYRISISHKGHSTLEYMSDEQIIKWKKSISNTLTGRTLSEATKLKLSISCKGNNPYKNKTAEEIHESHIKGGQTLKNKSEEEKKNISNKRLLTIANKSQAEQQRIHDKHSKSVTGSKNPVFGYRWMHYVNSDGTFIAKYVKPNDIQTYLANGYKFGKKP